MISWLLKAVWIAGTILVLLALQPLLQSGAIIDPYWFRILLLMGINVTLAVSLNLINGFCGQFSIAHAGFMAVGAYTSSYFTLHALYTPVRNLSFAQQATWMIGALLVGAVTAGIAGFIVGIPSLRLRGDYLAIATLGFGEIIRVAILNIEEVGGASGLSDIPPLSSFFWIWLIALMTIALSRNLLVSSHGRAVLAVREDEIAAEALGVPTTKYKVIVFAFSSALAGMAGVLAAHLDLSIYPSSFTFLRSIEIIVMVILGGLGSTTGAVLGAALVTLLPEGLRYVPAFTVRGYVVEMQAWRMVIYSLLLIVLMLTRPRGLLGGMEWSWHGLSRIGGRWFRGRPSDRNLPPEEQGEGDLL
ncbi:MAG: branched-chain amino acid ABC transporter permease [Armatimonadetes bacterium]|nr:branched-chain amino acid ABC transporter permease [Armatimonadota bacterium]